MLGLDRLVLNIIVLAADYRDESQGAPPDGWLDTRTIGRGPSYFSLNNRLGSVIGAFWKCQLKAVI
jgi:hypothetical protein